MCTLVAQLDCRHRPVPFVLQVQACALSLARNCSKAPHSLALLLQLRNGLNGNCLAVDNSTQFVAQNGERHAACAQ